MEKVMLGAGCFWGVEEYFRFLPGVTKTSVGYSGGELDNPSYKDVCGAETGHAEVLYIEYDPTIVAFPVILEHFWRMHDPTTLNQQGPDRGPQYRSVIYYYTDSQRDQAVASKAKLQASHVYDRPVVTFIEPARQYWPAEDYHQRYFEKRGGGHSCHASFPAYKG